MLDTTLTQIMRVGEQVTMKWKIPHSMNKKLFVILSRIGPEF